MTCGLFIYLGSNNIIMKHTLKLFVLLALIIVSSCKESESPIPNNQSTIECIKEHTLIYFNGAEIGTKRFVYDQNKLLEDELTFNPQNELTDSVHHSYDNNEQIIRSYYYNIVYDITQVQRWDHNGEGNVTSYELEVNGSVTSTQQYFYNPKGNLDSVNLVYNGVPTRQLYTYKSDALVLITTIDEQGSLSHTDSYNYLPLKTTIVRRDADNSFISAFEIITNESGQEVKWRQIEANGTASISRSTEYDDNGNIVKITDDYGSHGIYEYVTTWICE
jgi:hypothetical protein